MATRTQTKQARSLGYADVGEKAKVSMTDVLISGVLTDVQFKRDFNGTKTIAVHLKVEGGYSILKLAPESFLDIESQVPDEPKESSDA